MKEEREKLFVFLLLSLEFSVFWCFNYDVSWCGSVWFHLFVTLCPSCTWISVSFFRFGNFPALISSNHFDPLLFSFWDSYNVNVGMLIIIPEISETVLIFLKFVFLFAIPFGWFPLFYLPDHFCVLLYHLVCYSVLLVFFYFGYWILHFWGIFIFSSSLLKNSLYSSILFPSSGNILIMNVWNSLFDKLLISASLFIFPGIFTCSFNWDQFLYLLILLNSASN